MDALRRGSGIIPASHGAHISCFTHDPPTFTSSCHFEPLEARIAPALLVNGANLLGSGSPTTGETSIGGDEVTLVKVLSGQALVWFQDGEITSISVGANTNLEITGDITGAIIGNLMPNGRLSDSDNNPANGEDGAVLLPNNLTGLKTFPLSSQDGDVPAIITGGSVANVSINGKNGGIYERSNGETFNIDGENGGIYAGDGVFHAQSQLNFGGSIFVPVFFDFNPVELGVQAFFEISLGNSPDILPGASVKNVTVQTAERCRSSPAAAIPIAWPRSTEARRAAISRTSGSTVRSLTACRAVRRRATSSSPATARPAKPAARAVLSSRSSRRLRTAW